MTLTREQIGERTQPTIHTLPVASLGGEICVRQMPIGQLILMAGQVEVEDESGKPRMTQEQLDGMDDIILATVCDDGGKLLYSEGERDAIAYIPIAVKQAIVEEVVKIAGLTEDGIKAKVKN